MTTGDHPVQRNCNMFSLKVDLLNARSIENKLHDIHFLLNVTRPDVICVAENWLNQSVSDNLLISNHSYGVLRKDREVSKVGGGVCIGLLSNINTVNAVSVFQPSKYVNLEMCVIDIFTNSCTYRLINCYRAPSSNRKSDSISYIKDMCNCITDLSPPNIIVVIFGDFNLPSIDWSADNCLKCSDVSSTGVFLNFYYNLGLTQFVS